MLSRRLSCAVLRNCRWTPRHFSTTSTTSPPPEEDSSMLSSVFGPTDEPEIEKKVPIIDDLGRAYGTGRRKTSVARVWIFPGTGVITVNSKSVIDYFVRNTYVTDISMPFAVTKTSGQFDVWCTTKGGGLTGQSGAIRLGISRALEKFNPDLRPPLRKGGYLTRDSRQVERKKPGLRKARKAQQWVKR